jgi:predicted nucleic acid-binding protein
MSLKVFIDTNVYLNSLENRDSGLSTEVIAFLLKRDIKLYLNDLSVINIHYIASRTKAKELITEKLKDILQTHSLVSIDKYIINNALDSEFKDFEDAVQYYCAKRVEADVIITSNKKDFKHSDINVLSPSEFYEKFMT